MHCITTSMRKSILFLLPDLVRVLDAWRVEDFRAFVFCGRALRASNVSRRPPGALRKGISRLGGGATTY